MRLMASNIHSSLCLRSWSPVMLGLLGLPVHLFHSDLSNSKLVKIWRLYLMSFYVRSYLRGWELTASRRCLSSNQFSGHIIRYLETGRRFIEPSQTNGFTHWPRNDIFKNINYKSSHFVFWFRHLLSVEPLHSVLLRSSFKEFEILSSSLFFVISFPHTNTFNDIFHVYCL